MKILMAEHTGYDSFCRVGSHHLADGLSRRGHDIFYMSAYLTPLHLLLFLTPRRHDIWSRFSNWFANGREWSDRIHSYVPFSLLPFAKWPILDNVWIANRQFEWTLPRLSHKLSDPFDALLIGDPRFLPLIDRIDAPVKIFRLTDDALSIGSTPKSVASLLRIGLPKCDHVIVTAKRLCRILEEQFGFSGAIYMPNGVDLNDFNWTRSYKPPADLAHIPAPRVIYVGSCDERIDLSLIQSLAEKLPSVSFVFIGPQYVSTKRLKNYSNIHFLGPRAYSELPRYFSSSQAAMIPFLKTKRTDAMCSIKLLQYLAAGLPTVSTRLDEVESQNAPIALASNADEFAACLQSALSQNKHQERYRIFTAQFSWENNVREIEKLIGA